MKIAVLSSHPIQYYTPIFKYISLNCECHVFYCFEGGAEYNEKSAFGVKKAWDIDLWEGYQSTVLQNKSSKISSSNFFGCNTPDIFNELKNGKFDGLLITGWNLFSYWQALFSARLLGIPVLVRGDSQLSTPRSMIRRNIKSVMYPILFQLFSGFLAVGVRSSEYYDHYGVKKERIFASPHCIDTARFADGACDDHRRTSRALWGVGERELVILFAGKLVDFKRPRLIIDICESISAAGYACRAVFAGSGELADDLRKHAKSRKIRANFLGFQNQSEMPAVFAGADILVLPSNSRETWGLVCNEALACNTPIAVSAEAGCAPDLATDPIISATFDPQNIVDASDKIIQLLMQKRTSSDFDQINESYSVEAAAVGILNAFATVIAKRERKSG